MYDETHPILIGDLRESPPGKGVKYGDISPRTAAYAVEELLKQSHPSLMFEKFGTVKPLPESHRNKFIKFKRYANKLINHVTDAYVYGTGVSHVYYDEQTKEVTGKNPDGTTYPLALRQIKIQPEEKT
jgi:hypothetical protein